MRFTRKLAVTAALAAMYAPIGAWATNGMNLEGYGPVSLGAGGTGFAYDNGTAAVMNNPATIGLMPEGHRADIALGKLGPDVSAKAGGSTANSSGTAYYMPALGWITRSGQLGYGVGVFAQGGMGTDYKGSSFMSAGSGEPTRSELGVGRLIAPLTYEVSPGVIVGGSIDFVWAGLDLQMAMSGAQFLDMVGGTQAAGTVSGDMTTALNNFIMGGLLQSPTAGNGPVNWGYFDFSNDSDYTGEAMGTGFAGKIGAVFKVNSQIALGVTYHTKTALADLESSDASVTFSANVDDNLLNQTWDGGSTGTPAGTYTAVPIELTGKIKVKDFEWPAMLGVGGAFQPASNILVAVDIKRIFWSDVMKDFSMTFTSDATQSGLGAGFADKELDATLFQKWEDQTVIAIGGAIGVTPEATVRVGYNRGSNSIPNKYLNALFPAIQENHITAGVGYAFNTASSVDFALSKGLDSDATNSQNSVKSTMSQLNWQLMYSHRY